MTDHASTSSSMTADRDQDAEPVTAGQGAAGIWCSFCGKRFTRKEHLERHLPIHTFIKPHICPHCYIDFARRDLLTRHVVTYHRQPQSFQEPPTMTATPATMPPRIACSNCSTAKTACDKDHPCARCKEKGLVCEERHGKRGQKQQLRAERARNGSPPLTGHVAQQPLPQSPFLPTVLPTSAAGFGLDGARPEQVAGSIATADGISAPGGLGMHQHQRTHSMSTEPLHTGFNGHVPWASPSFGATNMAIDPEAQFLFLPPNGQYANQQINFDEFANNGQMVSPNPSGGLPFPVEQFISSPESANQGVSESAGFRSRNTSVTSGIGNDGSQNNMVADVTGAIVSPHTENSVASQNDIALAYKTVIAAEAGWSIARCNGPLVFSGQSKKTAVILLRRFVEISRFPEVWSQFDQNMEPNLNKQSGEIINVVEISETTRDTMMVMIQDAMSKAVEIHREEFKNERPRPQLPSAKMLRYLLQSCGASLEFCYSLVSSGRIDANEMVSSNDPDQNTCSALLLLLMVAQGASSIRRPEIQAFAMGLVELCRISTFGLIEQNVHQCANPTALRCAFLFVLLGAWSGDKWLMDISESQRRIYLSMMKNAGIMHRRPQYITSNPMFNGYTNTPTHEIWREWLSQETISRLLYNWVMEDQELNLFHDNPISLPIGNLTVRLPHGDDLWGCKNANEWQTAMGNTSLPDGGLLDLYWDFQRIPKVDNSTSRFRHPTSAQQFRLLLQPLQSEIWSIRHRLSSLPEDWETMAPGSRPHDAGILEAQRLNNAKGDLQKWWNLHFRYQQDHPDCLVTKTNAILFHLISLNTTANVTEIEQVARLEGYQSGDLNHTTAWSKVTARQKHCLDNARQAVLHCGQVLKNLSDFPPDHLPGWWGLALYRATIILWFYSVAQTFEGLSLVTEGHLLISINNLAASDILSWKEFEAGRRTAALTPTKHDDNGPRAAPVPLSPNAALDFAVAFIAEGPCSLLSRGIQRKLQELKTRWSSWYYQEDATMHCG